MTMTIGEVAKAAGVSARSLRYYEQQGLLESDRTVGGQRRYGGDAVDRIEYLQRLYRAGLSSEAIRAVLPCLETPSVLTSDQAYERLLHEREAMRGRLTELERTIAALDAVLVYNRQHRPSTPRQHAGESASDRSPE